MYVHQVSRWEVIWQDMGRCRTRLGMSMLTEISGPGTETEPYTAFYIARVLDLVRDSTVTVALLNVFVRPIIWHRFSSSLDQTEGNQWGSSIRTTDCRRPLTLFASVVTGINNRKLSTPCSSEHNGVVSLMLRLHSLN